MDAAEKLRVHRGLAWVGLASTLVALLDTVAAWLILRLWISPAEYGVATLVVTLFPILDLATDLGLTAAVIQRDDHTPERISTLFWLNLGLSLVLAALLVPAWHLLAAFHGQAVLAPLLIAYGGKLVFQNVYSIPGALMRRELRQKELQLIRIVANVAEFIAKLGFAASGFGVWTFLLAPLCRVFVTGVGIQLRHPWRPRFVLHLRDAADSVRFGLKASASQILFFFYTNIDYQVVGKYFGPTALGFYRWAYELVLEPVKMISGVAVEVAFPVFARLRQRPEAVIDQLVAFTRQNLAVVLPFVSVVLLTAGEILIVLLGPEWAAAATAARVLCFVGLLRSMGFLLPPLLDGMGHPSRTLTYMTVCAVLLPASYVASAHFLGPHLGYLSVAIGWAIGYPIAFAVLLFLALRTIGLGVWPYLRRFRGIFACTAVALAVGYAARWLAADASPGVRLLAVAVSSLGVLGLLLARVEGISLVRAGRALRGK